MLRLSKCSGSRNRCIIYPFDIFVPELCSFRRSHFLLPLSCRYNSAFVGFLKQENGIKMVRFCKHALGKSMRCCRGVNNA